jgi:hypothetical protein
MSANDKRISHYASEYQHWDLVVKIPLGYLEGCSTKYVARWRKKGGMEDLHKAMHYLDKLIESFSHKPIVRELSRTEIGYEVSRFAAINHLSIIEEEYILLLSNYRYPEDLHTAHLVLEDIIDIAKQDIKKPAEEEPNYPGTPEDGGHHAKLEPGEA